jgi:transposase InsO family protein
MIRDRDAKFTSGFDMIFKSIGIEAVKLPAQSPNLNAFAERFVRSIKSECLDRMIFIGEGSLRHAVIQYIEHHQTERPHQGIGNVIPFPPEQRTIDCQRDGPIVCHERLGGLLRSYHRKEAA